MESQGSVITSEEGNDQKDNDSSAKVPEGQNAVDRAKQTNR